MLPQIYKLFNKILHILSFHFHKIVLEYNGRNLKPKYQKEDIMAKKFGKFMLMSSIGAAVGAGIYYYMKGKKDVVPEDNFDADDFDDFDDDLDDDLDETASIPKSHPHIPIDLDSAKEKIGGKVIETLDKAKEIIGEMTSVNPEPTYTKVDLPAHGVEKEADETKKTDAAPITNVQGLSAEAEKPKTEAVQASDMAAQADTEEFFDDSDK